MFLKQILTFILLAKFSTAFNKIHPAFLDSDNSYYVSVVEKLPPSFIKHQKQGVLNLNASTTTTEIKESSSLTQSIQTETMTAGMSYLYSNNEDQAYSVNITLNAKDYPVLIDTGSPYLWLYSTDCQDDSCKDKKLFDPNDANLKNGTFALSYDSGVASGLIYDDAIIIGGFETHNFSFGVADKVPDLFENYGFSGVLGLPADNTSNTGLVNAISFLSENGNIDSSKFTICFGDYDSDTENNGLLFFGSTKEILHDGDIYESPIIQEAVSHWEIEIESVYVNDYQINFDSIQINGEQSNTSRIGLLDSGTTSLVLSENDANRLHSFFDSSITDGQNYAILCNSTLEFIFEISDKNWTLTPDMYIGSQYGSDTDLDGYCISNIQGLDSTADGAWILGILFMKDKYVEFDYENQLIGLAERNNNIKFVNPPKNTTTPITSDSTLEHDVQTTLVSSTLVSSTSSTQSITASVSSHSNNANISRSVNNWIYLLLSAVFL